MPILSKNIKILNLSNNNILSTSFLKNKGESLELVNLNNNKLTNICDLLLLENVEEIYVKNNLIDHISSNRILLKKYLLF